MKRYEHILKGHVQEGDFLVWPDRGVVEPALGMIGLNIYDPDTVIVLRPKCSCRVPKSLSGLLQWKKKKSGVVLVEVVYELCT
jgi:hypothetical protein